MRFTMFGVYVADMATTRDRVEHSENCIDLAGMIACQRHAADGIPPPMSLVGRCQKEDEK